MNYTKSKSLALMCVLAMNFGVASARDNGGPSNNNGPTTNNYNTQNHGGAGGQGGQGGRGGDAAAAAIAGAAAISGSSSQAGVIGSGNSTVRNDLSNQNSVRNDVSNTNLNANHNSVRNDNANVQGQGQQQGQQQGQGQQQNAVSNSGGNKLTNEGNNSKQATTVVVEGDTVESNTPPVMPGVLPSVPTSCRLYLFGGGSTRDGAGSGTFPIGNDQTCLSIAALNLMERAGGFSQAEKQAVVCKVEGMSDMETCKNLGSKKSASAAPAVQTPTAGAPSGFEHANLSDPSIRRRAGLPPL